MCVYTRKYVRIIISVPCNGPETITKLVEVMLPSAQMVVLTYRFPLEEAKVLGNGLTPGLTQDWSKVRPENLGSLEPGIGRSTNTSCCKRSGANTERLPLARACDLSRSVGSNWAGLKRAETHQQCLAPLVHSNTKQQLIAQLWRIIENLKYYYLEKQ